MISSVAQLGGRQEIVMIQDKQIIEKVARLADLIVGGQPATIHFRSEQQFLSLVGMAPARLPVRVAQHRRR